MKTSILILVPLILLASCKKDSVVTPDNTPVTSKTTTTNNSNTSTSSSTQNTTPTNTGTSTAANFVDTLANLSALKIRACMDSTNYDETMFLFRKGATTTYNPNEDAEYLQGYGQLSLASISPDGYDLAINSLPYTPNMSMNLDMHAKNDGAYILKISYERTLPSTLQVWIRDNYTKDSVNVRKGNYSFNIKLSDTASFGHNRFQVVLKTVH
jgi:hypothetical protein